MDPRWEHSADATTCINQTTVTQRYGGWNANTNRVLLQSDKDFRSVVPHERVLRRVGNCLVEQLQRLVVLAVSLPHLKEEPSVT